MTDLSIVIVNYKTPGLVLDCLFTVYKESPGLRFEVLVVDNASGDNSRELILADYPDVHWIQMDYNAGFARANNAAIRIARGQSVLLLNSDTLVENKAIERNYQLFANSNYIACGVQLLNADRSPQISGNFFMRGGLNYLLPLPFIGQWVKSAGNLFKVAAPNVAEASSEVSVDWINGAYLMVKKTAIDKAGLMDEDFFLYAEEAEWCSRLGKYGKMCIYGQFHIVHLQGESSNEAFGSSGKGYYNLYDRKGLQIMLSNFVRIRKQCGVAWFLVQLFFYLVEIPVFFVGVLISLVAGARHRQYSFRQFRQYCKNIFIVAGLSFRIISNKPYFYKVL